MCAALKIMPRSTVVGDPTIDDRAHSHELSYKRCSMLLRMWYIRQFDSNAVEARQELCIRSRIRRGRIFSACNYVNGVSTTCKYREFDTEVLLLLLECFEYGALVEVY
jgi:hypothetical protein